MEKPPSTAAVPPHRVRFEAAAMETSLDTFSTLAGVPIERLTFVDGSGEEVCMPLGADGPRQLEVWATPSKRRWSTIFAAPSSDVRFHVTNASYSRLGGVYRWISEFLANFR
jgi:hypothetical protein